MAEWLVRINVLISIALIAILALRWICHRLQWNYPLRWIWFPALLALPLSFITAPIKPTALASGGELLALPSVVIFESHTNGLTLSTFLIALWAVGALFLFIRLIASLRSTSIAFPTGPRIESTNTELYESPNLNSPVCIGIFRRKVLVPRGYDWDSGLGQAVIAHEQRHIQCFDVAQRFVALCIQALCWPNPLVHIARKALWLDQEADCDQFALSRHGHISPAAYARHLLSLPSAANNNAAYCSATSFTRSRIMQILKGPETSHSIIPTAMVILASLWTVAAWAATSDELPAPAVSVKAQQVPSKPPAPERAPAPTLSDPAPAAHPENPAPPSPPESGYVPSDSELYPVKRVAPKYPANAAKERVEGWVTLAAEVEADGSLSDIRVTQAHPEGVFDQVAMAAFEQWEFKPGLKRATVEQTMEFALD